MSRAGLVVAAAGLALACNGSDSVTPYEAPTVGLSADAAWSGGTVRLSAARFGELAHLPVIVAGAETLAVSAVADTIVEVRLPRRPAGPVELAFLDGKHTVDIGTVQLAGYVGLAWYAPGFDFGVLVLADRAGLPVVVGNGTTGLTAFYPTLQRADSFTGLRAPAAYYGVGPSYLGDRFVLRDSTNTVGVWSLWPAPARLGDWPVQFVTRQAALLAPSIFLSNLSHVTTTLDTTAATTFGPFAIEDSWGMAFSPRGDRLILRSVVSHAGVPVLDPRTGDTTYSLSANTDVAAAAFSPDGAELFVTSYGATATLRRYDATTGQAGLAVALPDSAFVSNMALDAASRRLYVATIWRCLPRVLVFDPATLTLAGDAAVPASVTGLPCANSTWEGQLVVHDAPDRVWVVWNGDPFPVFEFDVAP